MNAARRCALGLLVAATVALGACVAGPSAGASRYKLVKPATVRVSHDAFSVTPTGAWNQLSAMSGEAPVIENWTRDGPLLNLITFIGGLREGERLIRRDEVPPPSGGFKADMKGADLAELLEPFFRDRGKVQTYVQTSTRTVRFLDGDGVQVEFDYMGEDQVPRRGSCVMTNIDGRLYALMLAGEASHYFGAVQGEYWDLVASAVRKP